MTTQMTQPQAQPRVYLFLDRAESITISYARFLTNVWGLDVKAFTTPSQCLARVQEGLGEVDVIVVHKDLGVHSAHSAQGRLLGITSNKVVQAIHDEAPHVRVGVESGEYPHGERHVLDMGADFYYGPEDGLENWTLEQLRKGWVSEEEQAKRGKAIERPPQENWYHSPERR